MTSASATLWSWRSLLTSLTNVPWPDSFQAPMSKERPWPMLAFLATPFKAKSKSLSSRMAILSVQKRCIWWTCLRSWKPSSTFSRASWTIRWSHECKLEIFLLYKQMPELMSCPKNWEAQMENCKTIWVIQLCQWCTLFEIFIFCPKTQLWFPEKNCRIVLGENSWKCCGFGLFSCWQLWFHEKNCKVLSKLNFLAKNLTFRIVWHFRSGIRIWVWLRLPILWIFEHWGNSFKYVGHKAVWVILCSRSGQKLTPIFFDGFAMFL